MKMERRSWDRRPWEEQNEPSSPSGSFGSFVVAVTFLALCIWGALLILKTQGAIDWSLEWWQSLVMSVIMIAVNALFQVSKMKP
jgi:hypothetical protein